MKTKSYIGTVYAQTTKTGQKYLYFKTPLYKKGKATSTGLIDTPAHRKIVITKLKELQYNQFIEDKPIIEKYIFEIFNLFIEYCINKKGLATKTIQSYKYAFNKVFIDNYKLNETIKINNKKISLTEYYINNIHNLELSNNSKAIIMRSIFVFINWLFEEEYINPFSLKKYKIISTPKKIETFTLDEIESILNEAKKQNIKVYQFLLFLANTGARGKEAIELKFTDIDFKNGLITFPNKINKHITQTIPLNETALNICKELRQGNTRLNVFDYSPTSLRFISKVLTRIMNKLKIKRNVKLHAFRKYYATRIVESGASPFETQKLVRHANIQTTISHYYSQDNKKLKEILNIISTK